MATPDTKMTTDMELAEEIERMKREAGGRNQFALWLLTNVDEIIAALRRGPEPYKAVRGGGRLTYDKATRTIRDSDGAVRLELGEGDADMFCERPPSGEMVPVPRELIDRALLWFHTLAENGMDATFSDGERTPNAVAMDDIAAQFSALKDRA